MIKTLSAARLAREKDSQTAPFSRERHIELVGGFARRRKTKPAERDNGPQMPRKRRHSQVDDAETAVIDAPQQTRTVGTTAPQKAARASEVASQEKKTAIPYSQHGNDPANPVKRPQDSASNKLPATNRLMRTDTMMR